MWQKFLRNGRILAGAVAAANRAAAAATTTTRRECREQVEENVLAPCRPWHPARQVQRATASVSEILQVHPGDLKDRRHDDAVDLGLFTNMGLEVRGWLRTVNSHP